MRQFKKIFWISLALFCLFSSRSNAQNIIKITPDNVTASADEIIELFGGMVSVTSAQIENFYLDHWVTNPHDGLSPYPEAEVVNISDASVTFDWDYLSSPATNDFRVSYLNLSTGIATSATTTNNTITVTPPNDLYLFAFQTESLDEQSSSLTIIIIEKPVSISPLFKSCKCSKKRFEWAGSFSNILGDDNRLVYKNWSEITSADEYYVKVTTNDGLSAEFNFLPFFNNQGVPTIIQLPSACMINTDINESETLLYMFDPGDQNDDINTDDYVGLFGFTHEFLSNNNPSFSFNYSQPLEETVTSGRIFLYTCGTRYAPTRENDKEQFLQDISLKSLSNPFRQSTGIRYTLPEDEAISIALYDHQGRIVKQFKDQEWTIAGDYSMDLQLNDLAKGMYFCLLKTEKETLSLKLVKIE